MHELLLIIHITGIAMGIGVSFAHMVLGISRSKMTPEEAGKDALRSLSLGILGDLGITFLIVSGLFLMGPYWGALFQMPLLQIKLGLVIVLVILLIMLKIHIRKAVKNPGGSGLKIIQKIGQFTLPLGLTILTLAVVIFK
ncbi:MAG: hypothetical protein A2X22_10730 [Bacteroidetes bacterium GWF2_49_14]|nr:MAG: hypothetical protein A2X22_10730 [Bacteroidetes bacterium GWF2_49_14]